MNIGQQLLSLTLVLLAAPGGDARAQAPGTTSSALSAGAAGGSWDLPGPALAGDMTGVLAHNGRVIFELDAELVPDPTGPGGTIRGVARRRAGPAAGSFSKVFGTWRREGPGAGTYQLALVQASPGAGAPEPIAFSHGSFFDPNGPLLPLGRFHGTWKRP